MRLKTVSCLALFLIVASTAMTNVGFALEEPPTLSTLLIALNYPLGAAVDSSGDVYFTEYGGPSGGWLRKLSRNGSLMTLLSNLTTPTGVAVDPGGNVYFAETSIGTVKRLETSSSTVEVVAEGLEGVWGLAYDGGYLYVSVKSPSGTVKRINLRSGVTETVLDGLDLPYGITVDSLGNLYVVENGFKGNGTLLKLPKGQTTPMVLVDNLQKPYAVAAYGPSHIYVTEKLGRLLHFNPTAGSLVALLEGLGRVYGAAVDAEGNLFLTIFGSPVAGNTGSLQVYGNPPAQLMSPPKPLEIEQVTGQVEFVLEKVENIRNLTREGELPVRIFYREFFHRYQLLSEDESFWELAQQEYESLYLVPEGFDVKEIAESFVASAVLGFYDFDSNQIFIVTSERSRKIDGGVLAHELTHALTWAHYADAYRSTSDFTDESLARLSLVEGDADFVEAEYLAWCRSVSDGRCPLTADQGATLGPSIPRGMLLIELFPYTVGKGFVQSLYNAGGWTAVNEAYLNPPTSAEQIIHPEKYLADFPKQIPFDSLQPPGWQIIGVDTLGEASIYSMFASNAVVQLTEPNFKSASSAGWGGDTMVVLRKDANYGYIWRTLWDTPADADEFLQSYESLLARLGAEKHVSYWKIDDNDYVYLDRQLLYVTIVNGPSEASLSELYPASSNSPIRIQDVEIRDHTGSTAQKITVGEQILIHITTVNEDSNASDLSSVVHVRNNSGQIVFVSALTMKIDSRGELSYEVGWSPTAPGEYAVELATWRSLSDPTPLSSVSVANIVVTG